MKLTPPPFHSSGKFLREILLICSVDYLWGQALMLDEKAWLSIFIPVHPKGGVGQGSRLMLEYKRAFPKLFLQSCKHSIQNILVWWSIKISLHWNLGTFQPMKKHFPSSTKFYSWHNAVIQVTFYWCPATQTRPSDCQTGSVIIHSPK